jgi:catechol 2,3-dioxygenase-like lactoylglutathione lyase family enzyme
MALSDARVHTTLPASDLERAKDFYARKLSLKPSSERISGLYYDCADGTRFLLYRSRGAANGSHTQIGFAVADVEATVAELKAHGVTFEEYDLPGLKTEGGIGIVDGVRSAFFKDSEGNLLSVFELRPA